MEVYTLINKNNNNLVRINRIFTNDADFGSHYYLTDEDCTNDSTQIWIVEDEKYAKNILKGNTNKFQNIKYQTPNTEDIDISNYEVLKIEI